MGLEMNESLIRPEYLRCKYLKQALTFQADFKIPHLDPTRNIPLCEPDEVRLGRYLSLHTNAESLLRLPTVLVASFPFTVEVPA